MYQSALVPRVIPLMGLIGGALLATAIIATLLGLIVQTNPLSPLAALPVALWEFSLRDRCGPELIDQGHRTRRGAALDACASGRDLVADRRRAGHRLLRPLWLRPINACPRLG